MGATHMYLVSFSSHLPISHDYDCNVIERSSIRVCWNFL